MTILFPDPQSIRIISGKAWNGVPAGIPAFPIGIGTVLRVTPRRKMRTGHPVQTNARGSFQLMSHRIDMFDISKGMISAVPRKIPPYANLSRFLPAIYVS
ncbi:MAG: hypothetical protein JXL20_00960 [Deltaproteobacteria bacterium]|nr:hypothetical protein [Deltaproteobacteria bacterium]